jgi:hypothetical protein
MTAVTHPLLRIAETFNNPDIAYWDGQNRERFSDDVEDWLIDNLIPLGASVIYADPGAGKSFILQSVIHHLVYGTPLGPWGSEGPGRALCAVYDLEGTWKMVQDRGFSITPYGDAPADGDADRQDNWCLWMGAVIPPLEREAWAVIGRQAQRHIAYLDQMLTDAELAGAPVRLVVIDTLTKFAGPRPRSAANAYEHESELVDALNRVALAHRCAIVIIHHTNKAGEISGSTGIGGSAIVTARLDVDEQTDADRDAEKPRTAVLRSTKVRIGAPFVYAMHQAVDGPWLFVDQPPNETLAAGQARRVLAVLNNGPRTLPELRSRTGLGSSLGQVLNRMRKARQIFPRHGKWHVVADDVLIRSLPGQVDGTCEGCGGPMTRRPDGHGGFHPTHPGCDVPRETSTPDPVQETPGPAPDAPTPDPAVDDDVVNESEQTPAEKSAFTMLRESIEHSRMKPVGRIRKADRDGAPWSLITERMTGEHRWLSALAADVADDTLIGVLDRNASYPSAMSSVTVAANILTHTGALDERGKRAGILLTPLPFWDAERHGIGHPLGRMALGREVGEPIWVPTPHFQTLEKLARMGLIPPPAIHDSWTGRATNGLFSKFSASYRDARADLMEDPRRAGDLAHLKTMASIAMRGFWNKEPDAMRRSPWWRPDWSVSVRGEAATRHWWRGQQCATGDPSAGLAPTTVLRMASVDEVVVVMRGLSVPYPYKIGTKFGEVKWKRVKIDGVEHPSPLPAALWRQSVLGLKAS